MHGIDKLGHLSSSGSSVFYHSRQYEEQQRRSALFFFFETIFTSPRPFFCYGGAFPFTPSILYHGEEGFVECPSRLALPTVCRPIGRLRSQHCISPISYSFPMLSSKTQKLALPSFLSCFHLHPAT